MSGFGLMGMWVGLGLRPRVGNDHPFLWSCRVAPPKIPKNFGRVGRVVSLFWSCFWSLFGRVCQPYFENF